MVRKLAVTAIVFGFTLLACLSVGIRHPSALETSVPAAGERVVLAGNVSPKALPDFDEGPTDPSLPMNRMILHLKTAPDKKADLERLLADQQDPSSPNFHHWLTPEEFGQRFGRTPEEIATVQAWLNSQGFSIDETAKGGNWINFSGTAAAVDRAFHANMHDYRVNGRLHHANSTDPSIPNPLADIVAGPVALHSFHHKPMHTPPRPPAQGSSKPDYTESNGAHDLAPGDFNVIYDVGNAYNLGFDGTGVTIAIVGRTHPDVSKWNTFRSTFGLSNNSPIVTVNGPDPGDLGAAEDTEADLDVEWSGAVAKGATINFVTSASTGTADGSDLSAQYIVDKNLASIMSDSFETCEPDMGSTRNSFYYNLWQQAAAQGITVLVGSGDNGAYDCTDSKGLPTGSRAVNGLASTPYNVAVGGTQFSDGGGVYWSTENSASGTSVLGYIPEVAWDDLTNNLASGGGASSVYGKPAWQVCPGVPNDSARDVPDVALNADSNIGYRIYTCSTDTGPCTSNSWCVAGGTSASSPSFAGIMALIVQAMGQRLGNVNGTLYGLGNTQYGGTGVVNNVYHDITSGNNGLGAQLTGNSCAVGYDLVTGLGSVNATNLLLAFQEGGIITTPTYSDGITTSGAMGITGSTLDSGTTASGLDAGSDSNTFSGGAGLQSQATDYSGQDIPGSGTNSAGLTPGGAGPAAAPSNGDAGTGANSGATGPGVNAGANGAAMPNNTVAMPITTATQSITVTKAQKTTEGENEAQWPSVPSFQIDKGASATIKSTVTLNNSATLSPTQYMASESPDFTHAAWRTYSSAPKFTLSTGGGLKTVYFKVRNGAGESPVVSNSITRTAKPTLTFFKVNNGEASSASRTVSLNNTATGEPTQYMAGQSPTFAGIAWQPYSLDPNFTLSAGNGSKTVYLKVKNAAGVSSVLKDTITLAQPPTVTSFKIDKGAAATTTRKIRLNNTVTLSPTRFMASEAPDFAGATWQAYSAAPTFILSDGGGTKTVYFKVSSSAGESDVVSGTIQTAGKPTQTSFQINNSAQTASMQTE